jgi:hypothetical protein
MRFWHRHQWIEVNRVFARSRLTEVEGIGALAFERLAFGVTSIELRCDCGDVRERQLLGDHT